MSLLKEALLYKKLPEQQVHCSLCAHYCLIAENHFGFCGMRENIDGVLYTHAYGTLVAEQIDPIEKKPLYHFLPGSKTYSIATAGCNFHCGFCQNWQISQLSAKQKNTAGLPRSPQQIIVSALESGCQSISYTYTEPTIFFEYALETAKLASAKKLANIFVTNGYMSEQALRLIAPYLNAANIDLKSFSAKFYKNLCQGKLQPVLETIKLMHELKIWVEITTLLIPGENDDPGELKQLAEFIATVSPEIPWHISAFHPDYKFMNHGYTELSSLNLAQKIGRQAGLKHIYLCNI